MKPPLMRAVLFLLLLAGGELAVSACSCTNFSTRHKYRRADAVFLGKIVEVVPNQNEQRDFKELGFPYPFVVRFKVERRWKGAGGDEITVLSAADWDGMCGDMNLAVGTRYLIYATRDKRRLTISADCGPNVPAEHAGREMEKLEGFWFRLFARVSPF